MKQGDYKSTLMKLYQTIEFDQSVRGKKYYYANINMCVEILTSNTTYNNVMISIPYLIGVGIKVDNKYEYIYFRTFDEFVEFIEWFHYQFLDIAFQDGKPYIVCYTSDLALFYITYKDWIDNDIDISSIFSVNGKPAYFKFMDIIEFRCAKTYLDFNNSTYFGKEPKHHTKLIKTPESTLDELDYRYVEFKLNSTLEYMEDFAKLSGGIGKTPVTKIRHIKNLLNQYCLGGFNAIKDCLLVIQSIDECDILDKIPSGGLNHINNNIIGKTIKDVYMFDITSYYPSIMYNSTRFPIKYIGFVSDYDDEQYLETIKTTYVESIITFYNVKLRDGMCPYIHSRNIMDEYGVDNLDIKDDNLYSADVVSIPMTDIEFEAFIKHYDFTYFESKFNYLYKRGMLPNCIIDAVCQMFELKESTTGAGRKIIKAGLNSISGLMRISPYKVYPTFNGLSSEEHKIVSKGDKLTAIDNYNKDIKGGKVTSCFQWGVAICSLGRLYLSEVVEESVNLNCHCYCDTDSEMFTYNEKMFEVIDTFNTIQHEANENAQICRGKKRFYEYNGKEMGIFSYEGCAEKFKVLAQKEYIYYCNDKLTLKTAGISKVKFKEYLNKQTKGKNNKIDLVFNIFNDKLVVDNVRRYTLYLEKQPDVIIDFEGKEYKNQFKHGLFEGYGKFVFNIKLMNMMEALKRYGR